MPFVLRQVTPVRLCRLPDENRIDSSWIDHHDIRHSIQNRTLSSCLRQLASLVRLAGDIFDQCHREAADLDRRTADLGRRLDTLLLAKNLDSRTAIIREFYSYSIHLKDPDVCGGTIVSASGGYFFSFSFEKRKWRFGQLLAGIRQHQISHQKNRNLLCFRIWPWNFRKYNKLQYKFSIHLTISCVARVPTQVWNLWKKREKTTKKTDQMIFLIPYKTIWYLYWEDTFRAS